MPLTKSMPDPFSTETLPSVYVRSYNLELAFARKHIIISFGIWRDEEAWESLKVPISTFKIELTPDGVPALYGDPPIITPGIPGVSAVLGPSGEVIVEEVIEVPPVYGDAELIKAAFPSFDEVLAQNQAVYDALAVAINTLAKLYDPELTDIVEG